MAKKTAKTPQEQPFPGKIQPSKATDIQYTAYIRTFPLGRVLYITATCSYPVGPYEIFFQGNGGFT